MPRVIARQQVVIGAAGVSLEGELAVPDEADGVVAFAHGSGSSRFSPRNIVVADTFNEAGLATLLFDLLTPEENRIDIYTRHLRFDIDLLAPRVVGAVEWIRRQPAMRAMRVGLFGASTGAAAALVAAAERPGEVAAVVSRGGRPDLSGAFLPLVAAPTLLIVGENDTTVLELNRNAARQLRTECQIEIVPGATHLFEETGALEEVSELAVAWFQQYLKVR